MAWEDMLDHKCDIFHVQNDTNSLGYGVSDTEHYSYPNKADIEDVDCHFHVKTGRYVISQTEPANDYSARVKLSLPFGTDIRINDKVVSKKTGFSYIAELPRTIRNNHHIIVYCNREGTVKEAI